MAWVDYGGQDVSGYDYIGTDTLKYPIDDTLNVEQTVEEIKRRCGRLVRIRLFKRGSEEENADR